MRLDTRPELGVFVVDDSHVVRGRLERLLLAIEGVRVLGHADAVEPALAGICRLPVDLVLLDMQLRERSGFEVLAALRARSASPAARAV